MSKRDISQAVLALAFFFILGIFANIGLDLMNKPSDIAFWGGSLILLITAYSFFRVFFCKRRV